MPMRSSLIRLPNCCTHIDEQHASRTPEYLVVADVDADDRLAVVAHGGGHELENSTASPYSAQKWRLGACPIGTARLLHHQHQR